MSDIRLSKAKIWPVLRESLATVLYKNDVSEYYSLQAAAFRLLNGTEIDDLEWPLTA